MMGVRWLHTAGAKLKESSQVPSRVPLEDAVVR